MSKKTDRQKERNQQYWKDRAERNILSAEKNADELLKIMKHSYNEANKLIREEIQNFYGRFTWKQGITYEETLQRLNRKELKLFQEQAKKYYDEAYAENWQTAYTDRMRTLSGRAYMSRLEELKVNIYHQYQKIAEELNVQLGEGLSKQYESSFEDMMYNLAHTTGIGVQIPKINDAIVEKTIKEKWLGGNYSSRVWQNKDKLADVLNKDLPVMFTLGKHPNVIAEHLSGKLENNFKNTVRLVRTEFNRIANESTADAYEKYGIEEYEFIATLDSKTSDICAELDNQRFKVKDREVGVNYPPMHPNCRSTTIAYFDDDLTRRIAKKEDGKYFYVSHDTTYKQWKEMIENTQTGGIIKAISTDDITDMSLKSSQIKSEVLVEISSLMKELNMMHLYNVVDVFADDSNNVFITDTVPLGKFPSISLKMNINKIGGKTVAEIDEMFSNADNTVCNSLKEALVHEKHHAMFSYGKEYSIVQENEDMMSEIHISSLSKTASKDGNECIAEVGVLIERKADDIPEDALEHFNKYKGFLKEKW